VVVGVATTTPTTLLLIPLLSSFHCARDTTPQADLRAREQSQSACSKVVVRARFQL